MAEKPVYLVLGASNANGTNEGSVLHASHPTLAYNNAAGQMWDITQQQWDNYNAYDPAMTLAVNANTTPSATSTKYGVEAHLIDLLATRHGGTSYWIKYALQGVLGDRQGGCPATYLRWGKSFAEIYSALATEWAAAEAALGGDTLNLRGVFWIHENDLWPGMPEAYLAALRTLDDNIHADFGSGGPAEDPRTPFVVARCHLNYPPAFPAPAMATLRQAQEYFVTGADTDPAVARAHAGCVDTDYLGLNADDVHYSPQGVEDLATALVNALDNTLGTFSALSPATSTTPLYSWVAEDAVAMTTTDDFGESMTYTGEGGATTVQGVVQRNGLMNDEEGAEIKDSAVVFVPRDEDAGVLAVREGQDYLTLSLRFGEPAETCKVVHVIEHDEGGWLLDVRR